MFLRFPSVGDVNEDSIEHVVWHHKDNPQMITCELFLTSGRNLRLVGSEAQNLSDFYELGTCLLADVAVCAEALRTKKRHAAQEDC